MISSLWKRIRGRGRPVVAAVLAPSYDDCTEATSRWATNWRIAECNVCRGVRVTHSWLVGILAQSAPLVILFVGHGFRDGLLTGPGLGKKDIAVKETQHGILLESGDLEELEREIHVVAWCCLAGSQFGLLFGGSGKRSFLGFDRWIGVTFGRDESELLWSDLISQTFQRVTRRGRVSRLDDQWLSKLLEDRRRSIRSGELTTGPHDRINTMFLKRAKRALSVCGWEEGNVS